jgi:hypothetical protein
MLTATRTFRVFVSSTFEDLKAERDALERNVSPGRASSARRTTRAASTLIAHRPALGMRD